MFHSSSNALRHHPRQRRHLIQATVGMQNQQNLYPKAPITVIKLLQYSGLGLNSGMCFLNTNDSQVIETGEFQFRFGVWLKTVRVDCLQAENKISKKCKIESHVVLGHWGWGPGATEVLQGLFLVLGRMTYSHLPNRFFI